MCSIHYKEKVGGFGMLYNWSVEAVGSVENFAQIQGIYAKNEHCGRSSNLLVMVR